jgi:hypothetical protein
MPTGRTSRSYVDVHASRSLTRLITNAGAGSSPSSTAWTVGRTVVATATVAGHSSPLALIDTSRRRWARSSSPSRSADANAATTWDDGFLSRPCSSLIR